MRSYSCMYKIFPYTKHWWISDKFTMTKIPTCQPRTEWLGPVGGVGDPTGQPEPQIYSELQTRGTPGSQWTEDTKNSIKRIINNFFFKEENQMCLYDINTSFGIQVWINSKLKCELTFLWPKSTLYLLGSMPALLKSFSPNFVSATNEIPNIWKQNSFKYIKQDRKV